MPDHTLVFIHGAGSNRDFWHEQEAAFPNAHFPNLPGHTASRDTSRGEGRHSIEEYADWVERYVNIAGLQGVVLNGHSMGGAITQTLALRQPAWLSAIVLTGSGARLRVLPEMLDLLRTDYPAAVELIVERSFAPLREPMPYPQRLRRNGVRRQLLRTPQAVTLGDYEACDRFDVMPRVTAGEITLPTLCLVGALDTMTPPRYTEFLNANIPGSRLAIIEDAGHMLPMEQPDEYNSILSGFIEALPTR